jgi:hypothetical protein
MKRFVLVLSVMAVMALLLAAMAVPAFAKNTGTEGGGPPLVSFGPHANVVHCPAFIDGDRGVVVINNRGVNEHNCQ